MEVVTCILHNFLCVASSSISLDYHWCYAFRTFGREERCSYVLSELKQEYTDSKKTLS